MPNRMLRDWTGSDKINSISVNAERFFTRLIMKVDDHGCFYADSRLLKANLFPLLLDNIREADLLRWMAECHKAGLIALYESAGKKYLQITDFRQRLDKARSKYPLPTVNDSLETVTEFPAEVEVEPEVEKKSKAPAAPEVFNEKIIYPFESDVFLAEWERWKKYKKDQHRFTYKSIDSEKTGLADLFKLAQKNEQTAIEIINQSIAKAWSGLFELKNKKNENGINQQPIKRSKSDSAERLTKWLDEEIRLGDTPGVNG